MAFETTTHNTARAWCWQSTNVTLNSRMAKEQRPKALKAVEKYSSGRSYDFHHNVQAIFWPQSFKRTFYYKVKTLRCTSNTEAKF
uniref:Uncharacterized protein n=1 Tax=Romanomermis culicivorax TaxID=13658 RepID=A0A915HQE2_ROMCU